ncbi:MAG TPA: lysine--tRNA ligase [Mucilaginibacter sp.]|jgi:lysyl-tRNA synthetase class 2
MKKEQAFEILHDMVVNPALRVHCLSVALVCEHFALLTGNHDPEKFFCGALLHDADYEQHPAEHPKIIVARLIEMEELYMAHAISCHGMEFGIPQESLLDRLLIAADELTGFTIACAKVRADGLVTLNPESVLKKFKDRKFAASVSREEVQYGLQQLGVDINSFTSFIIQVLQANAQALGLAGDPSHALPGVLPSYLVEATATELTYTRPVLDEQQQVRHRKRAQLVEQGLNVYPGDTVAINAYAADIRSGKIEVEQSGLILAGRIMAIKVFGKSMFLDLQDSTGITQLWINQDLICQAEDKTLYQEFCKKMLDRGDIIEVQGELFLTKTSEKTIKVTRIKLLTKSLRPLPVVKTSQFEPGTFQKHDDVTDPEFIYRQRYADLIIHPEKKQVFVQRAKIIQCLRNCFNETGALEAGTPILQPVYGGATARPFVTHHNTLDTDLYLRIANELYLKRLIVGGYDAVYEFSTDFRNEGMSRWHNPEFLQVEAYFAYKDHLWLMDFIEQTLETVVTTLFGQTTILSFGHEINFKRPWQRATLRDIIQANCGIDIYALDENSLRAAIHELDAAIECEAIMGKADLIDELFSKVIEPFIIQPTFITAYPVELSPLAKRSSHDPGLTDRFECFALGKEIANAFSELNDPVDQRERFEGQLALAKRGHTEAMMVDDDFLRALEYGMPPTAGLGLGIDRLCMILLDQPSIQDVLFFPQMKPETFK